MKLKNILILAAIALSAVVALTGVGLYIAWEPTNDEGMIRVNVSANGTEIVEFEDLHVLPGEESNYQLALYSPVNGPARVTLSFDEKAEGTLKNFVFVKITNEAGEVVCDLLLAEAMTQEFSFDAELGRKDPCELSVTYYMPEDVTNEAKNASALFDLVICACNEDT